MDVVSLSPFRVASVVWQPLLTSFALTFVVKATYELAPVESRLAGEQEYPNEEDNHWSNDAERSLSSSSDLVPFKPRAEVLLVGHAYAPRGEALAGGHRAARARHGARLPSPAHGAALRTSGGSRGRRDRRGRRRRDRDSPRARRRGADAHSALRACPAARPGAAADGARADCRGC